MMPNSFVRLAWLSPSHTCLLHHRNQYGRPRVVSSYHWVETLRLDYLSLISKWRRAEVIWDHVRARIPEMNWESLRLEQETKFKLSKEVTHSNSHALGPVRLAGRQYDLQYRQITVYCPLSNVVLAEVRGGPQRLSRNVLLSRVLVSVAQVLEVQMWHVQYCLALFDALHVIISLRDLKEP